MSHVVTRTCPLCEATCGLRITLDAPPTAPGERTVERVAGDPNDPFSAGFVCPKGAALGALHADPDRLRQPLVRVDGELRPASWDTAFERVADGLAGVWERHGHEAVGCYLGNPNVHNLAGALFLKPLIKALQTRAIFTASTMDQMPRHVVSGWLYGRPGAFPVPDLDRTDVLLIIGGNPVVSNGSLCTAPDFPGRLRAIQDRGGQVVVVDPRRTETAVRADRHVPIRPGTDVFLLLAMLNAVCARHGMHPPGHLADAVDDLDRLPELVADWPPERAAAITGVPAATIVELADALATQERASIYPRLGVHTSGHGTLAQWAVDLLNLVTGQLDVPGGAMFSTPAHETARTRPREATRTWDVGRWQSRVGGHPEVMGELPVVALPEEILEPGDGQLRALLTVAGNPARSAPNTARIERALDDLEFMVSVDPYLNETTRFADVVLPPPSPLERPHYDLAFYAMSVRNVANYSAPVLPLCDGALSESDILLRLTGIALGQGPDADTAALDDMGFAMYVQRTLGDDSVRDHGTSMPEVLAAVGDRRGPTRVLDFLLRSGRWGAGFAPDGEGLSVSALEAEPSGIDLGALEPRLPGFLRTPGRRLRAVPARVADALAALTPPDDLPEETLLMIGRRHLRSNNSWMHNLPRLAAGRGRCDLLMHPADADERGLSDGDTVVVARHGAASEHATGVETTVSVTDAIMRGVVCLPHGWGHDAPNTRLQVAAAHAGVNVNELTPSDGIDGLSGNARLNAIPVTVGHA